MGVTTQAAFVQSMMVVFAGGTTGLSAAVTGVRLSMVEGGDRIERGKDDGITDVTKSNSSYHNVSDGPTC